MKKIITEKNVFFVFLFMLYFSQLLIVVPGSYVGGGVYSDSQSITLFGFTYSALMSIVVCFFCFLKSVLVLSKTCFSRKHIICIVCLLAFSVFGLILSPNVGSSIDYLLKILMPFLVFFYLAYTLEDNCEKEIAALLKYVNMVLVLQVIACKVVTGSFSATHYYWYIMSEEYYGFYNSPHPFAAMLGILSIWNLWMISQRNCPKINVALLAANLILIALSGVRTYLLAVCVAVVLLLASSFQRRGSRGLRAIAIAVVIIGLFASGFLVDLLTETRMSSQFNTTEISSGRFDRWQLDLAYYLSGDSPERAFGRGFEAVYAANASLIGYYINSLNVVIDLLIDNGVAGLILILIAYYSMLSSLKTKKSSVFRISLLVYLGVGMMINNLLPYVTVMCASVLMLVAWHYNCEVESVSTCKEIE